jgi:hypothetical protein
MTDLHLIQILLTLGIAMAAGVILMVLRLRRDVAEVFRKVNGNHAAMKSELAASVAELAQVRATVQRLSGYERTPM